MENHQGSDGLEVDYILGLDVLIRIYETMKDTDPQNQRFCRIAKKNDTYISNTCNYHLPRGVFKTRNRNASDVIKDEHLSPTQSEDDASWTSDHGFSHLPATGLSVSIDFCECLFCT